MKKLFKQISIFALVVAIAALVGPEAFAAEGYETGSGTSAAGASLLTDLENNLGGVAGTTIGLLISLVGLYMWIWNQVSWGIIVAIGGALLTAFPNIYNNLREGAQLAFEGTTAQ